MKGLRERAIHVVFVRICAQATDTGRWFQTHNRFWLWLATTWVPGMPRRVGEIWSMMRFGGTMTLNGLVRYVIYNLEKVLLADKSLRPRAEAFWPFPLKC